MTIRTHGPLHLEDLEPRRFEDLVRQLLYDFRDWSEIEATGRSGSDEGFDVRAWEQASREAVEQTDGIDEEGEPVAGDETSRRQWLVQCKRERSISPAKIEDYLGSLPDARPVGLHGLLFVAACDFSKKARDRFIDIARSKGFAEARLWGRAEIEDQLFQPKNDHLLFAYCGFSLQMRQRSLKTRVRATLATKKALRRINGVQSHILLRDAADDRYPYLDRAEGISRHEAGRWKVFGMRPLKHDGLPLCTQRFMAFIDDDGVHWDYAEGMNDARSHQDSWLTKEDRANKAAEEKARAAAYEIWSALPQQNQAWLEVTRVVPYYRIIAVDEEGDEFAHEPHVYFSSADGNPFTNFEFEELRVASTYDARRCPPSDETRVHIFDRRGPLHQSRR